MQLRLLWAIHDVLTATETGCTHNQTALYVTTPAATQAVCACHVVDREALTAAFRLARIQAEGPINRGAHDASVRRALRALLRDETLVAVWPVGKITRRVSWLTYPEYLPEHQHPDVVSVTTKVMLASRETEHLPYTRGSTGVEYLKHRLARDFPQIFYDMACHAKYHSWHAAATAAGLVKARR
jgi:hypothetical protein